MDAAKVLGFCFLVTILTLLYHLVITGSFHSLAARYPTPNVLNDIVRLKEQRATPANGSSAIQRYQTVLPTDGKLQITKRKLILVYTDLFQRREWYHLPEKEAENYTKTIGCKVSNCEVSYDRSRLKDSDAVIFHARDDMGFEFLKEYSEKWRPLRQRWVYFISESPLATNDRVPLNGFFNWTMTYKKESDIWLPYQRYESLSPTEPRPEIRDYAEEKNQVKDRKLAIWVASNCGRPRDQLVTKLQEYITIDVGGNCGRFFKSQTPINCEEADCFHKVKKYKFYLALENVFCEQYVTEKYWFNGLQNDAVPVVLGGGPYSDPKVAIPGSYIDVQEFSSVKALADYLDYLDKNNTAYNGYFAWKQKYKLSKTFGWPFPDIWSCEICEKLHNDNSIKVYDKLSDFWTNEDCKGKDERYLEMIGRP